VKLRLGSVCSGAGGMDLGLERAGFELSWLCEIDPACRSVLRRHWPEVPIHEDLTQLGGGDVSAVDLLAGGTPCQDLSVAGRGAGLDGEKSGLFFDFVRLARELSPRWLLWENVAGALSSCDGEDFATVLESFTGWRPAVPERGWRTAGGCSGPLGQCIWRVLDAQHFGVPQRRRRVFVVVRVGGICPPEVLLDPESVCGDPSASREAGEVASALTAPSTGGGRLCDGEVNGRLVVAKTLTGLGKGGGIDATTPLVVHALTARHDSSEDGTGRGVPLVVHEAQITSPHYRANPKQGDPAPALNQDPRTIAFNCQQDPDTAEVGLPLRQKADVAVYQEHGTSIGKLGTLTAGSSSTQGVPFEISTGRPRRLTPRECERLMGWPDDWTWCGADGQEMSDSARYRMTGNGVVSPVAEWIGRRILATEEV